MLQDKNRILKSTDRRKLLTEQAAESLFALSAVMAAAAAVLVCLFLFAKGIPTIMKIGAAEFISGKEWRPTNGSYGIFPMLAGTLLVTLGAMITGAPVGVLTAVFMVYFCPEKQRRLMRAAVGVMAGIPSVVYGFFGLTVIVPIIRAIFGGRGMSLLAASILLGIMIMPTVIAVSESAVVSVPVSFYEGSLALGAGREYSVFHAVLPAAKSGIASALLLGIGRAMGETMAVIMVAGNQPLLPERLTDGVRTLTANIALEMGYAADLHREALIAASSVLFMLVLAVNAVFMRIKKER